MDAGNKKGRNPNPRLTANIFSLITFAWVMEIFRKGYKRDLEVEDLYDALDEHRSEKLGNKLEKLWNAELKTARENNKEPSLAKVLIRCYGPYFMLLGLVITSIELGLNLSQPMFLGALIRYFSPENAKTQEITRQDAFLYAVCIIVCSTFYVLIRHPYSLGIFHTGMKIRVGLCSLIYRKALRLSKTALGETTVGQAVNLLSNDVNRFDFSLLFLSYTWIGPIDTMIVAYMMWKQIGYASLAGVATILFFIPLQGLLGKMTSTLRLRTAKRTDQRIRFMNEIIVGIQVIKMYAWEKPFTYLVSLARKREIRSVRAAAYVRGVMLCFGRCVTKIAIFVSIVTYTLIDKKITPEKMFVVAAYFNIIKYTMADFFPMSITQLAESAVSVKRIKTFLLYDEVESVTLLPVQNESKGIIDKNKKNVTKDIINGSIDVKTALLEKIETEDNNLKNKIGDADNEKSKIYLGFAGGIRVSNVTAKWTKDIPENTLSNVNFDMKPGSLLAVIGPVGAGKTSLLHAILKELPLNSGSIMVGGTISYASQEPWLFSGPVRQNILFGQPMDRERYREVVKVCALERDFQLLPHGDKTMVGERGVTLSGGQRARINLARAVYKKADVYLLDDPLSAVDTHVGRHLFDDCISEFLQGKTRILVTHQLQYLHTADNIVILNNGCVEAMGTFNELHESGVDFAKQLTAESEDHGETEPETKTIGVSTVDIARQFSEASLHESMRRISESSTVGSVAEIEPKAVAEMRSYGSVSSSVYRSYCAAGGNCAVTMLVFGICALAQITVSAGDYWMSYWTNIEEKRNRLMILRNNTTLNGNNDTSPSEFSALNSTDVSPLLLDTTTSSITNSMDNFTLPEFLDTITFNTANTTDWLHYSDTNSWPGTNATDESDGLISTETCIYVYIGLVTALVVLLMSSSLCFYTLCMRASVRLHDIMFSSITRATMWFFNNNPSGQILNRFAKDMGSVDESLPHSMNDCVQIGLSILGVVLVVSIVNFWLLIPTAVMFVFFYMLRSYYVSTSRSVKRLEGITRSPVFSHLNASIQGLTTIRAFGAQTLLKQEFDGHQDLHSSAWFMFLTSTRAFGIWLDSACVMYIALVTLSFLLTGGDQYGGDVGLAITQAIGLTGMLQWGMRQSAELENNMTSLERVLEYTKVDSEPPLESASDKKPRESWPSKGAIQFNKVVLAYSKNDPAVLKNVSFAVQPSEKVGIVGRTGAGKSSLISALFRLVDISSGSIKIDDIEISSIGLHDLRSKISIIPQEPVLFSGTLRENLDPFDQYQDAALWSALAEVELKQAVDELPAGLSHKVSEGGSNFSVGQRQLLCLARAIIRNNKILVLDEATANVDPQTDELIQKTIRQKFANCTVLTIAHRLHTVMDSDRMLVMDGGCVAEFDHPYVLLKNENGHLYKMVEQTGHAMAESLFRVAETSYEKNRPSTNAVQK